MSLNMSRTSILLLVLAAFALAAADPQPRSRQSAARKVLVGERDGKRQQRYLSLFNVVQFKQDACVTESDNTMRGTCMTSDECNDNGGTSDGNCAAGFGVCCMFTSTCATGSLTNTISRNCTYLQNSGYPSSMGASTTCTYNFDRICDNLCQIRLDFDNLVTAQPPTADTDTGNCATSGDTFLTSSPTGKTQPTICGTMTGQHMFLETGTSGTAGSATITFGTATGATRTFKIKVTYYACDSPNKAPTDCIQYFTGASGTIRSYNFAGGQALINQRYANCIRQEEGFCSIQYTSSPGTTPDPFKLWGSTLGTATTAAETSACTASYVNFPNSNTPYGRVCGGTFSPVDAATTQGTVVQSSTPFRVETFFNTALGTAPTAAAIAPDGYSLDYSQVAC